MGKSVRLSDPVMAELRRRFPKESRDKALRQLLEMPTGNRHPWTEQSRLKKIFRALFM